MHVVSWTPWILLSAVNAAHGAVLVKEHSITSASHHLSLFQRDSGPCGANSVGKASCGMNICCSGSGYCGTSSEYCGSGCQSSYGYCGAVKNPPSCDASAGSAKKRTVGYYQGNNVYNRVCHAVQPSMINAAKYTHLNWAFASIDPTSLAVIPADSRDINNYPAFTNLRKSNSGLQTWISVGGYDFTSNDATKTTWSDTVASSANRTAFITGLLKFMQQYGFTGVDLDWEYPVDAGRSGRPADMKNLVQLLADMRARTDFGTKFGISVVMPPDPGYLQWWDAKGLLKNADFVNFMSYDLHGPWETSPPMLLRGQTDIRDIQQDAIPFWFDLSASDMTKVNFGLAYYGRGYTLSQPACTSASNGCTWKAASKPAPCTNSPGIMSAWEIQNVINAKGLTPTAVGDGSSMMKQITFDDQWIGYDDSTTFASKINYASSRCFGGTLAWSVDFDNIPGTTNSPPVSTDNRCGYANDNKNGAICGSGQCCSQSGYCGSSTSYCGAGCQSGACLYRSTSTDGMCGPGGSHQICGGTNPGCCSSYGYCQKDGNCGAGEQTQYSEGYSPGRKL